LRFTEWEPTAEPLRLADAVLLQEVGISFDLALELLDGLKRIRLHVVLLARHLARLKAKRLRDLGEGLAYLAPRPFDSHVEELLDPLKPPPRLSRAVQAPGAVRGALAGKAQLCPMRLGAAGWLAHASPKCLHLLVRQAGWDEFSLGAGTAGFRQPGCPCLSLENIYFFP